MSPRNLRPMPRPLFFIPESRLRLCRLQIPDIVRNIVYNLLAHSSRKHCPLNSLHLTLTSCTACGASDAAGVNITEPQGSISLSLRENITAPRRNITQTAHAFRPAAGILLFLSSYFLFLSFVPRLDGCTNTLYNRSFQYRRSRRFILVAIESAAYVKKLCSKSAPGTLHHCPSWTIPRDFYNNFGGVPAARTPIKTYFLAHYFFKSFS